MEDQSGTPPLRTHRFLIKLGANPLLWLRVPASAAGLGIGLALLDIAMKNDLVSWLSAGASAILGYLQPKTFWLSAFLLSLCLWIVHVVAITHGACPPFVESSIYAADACWESVLPNGLLGIVGATVGYFDRFE